LGQLERVLVWVVGERTPSPGFTDDTSITKCFLEIEGFCIACRTSHHVKINRVKSSCADGNLPPSSFIRPKRYFFPGRSHTLFPVEEVSECSRGKQPTVKHTLQKISVRRQYPHDVDCSDKSPLAACSVLTLQTPDALMAEGKARERGCDAWSRA
jgi:hypothetical protein